MPRLTHLQRPETESIHIMREVAAAHGLHCSRIAETSLVYNRPDTCLPGLLICRPQWAGRINPVRQSLRPVWPHLA
jgi:hypothetical protein